MPPTVAKLMNSRFDDPLVARVMRYIMEHIAEEICLEDLLELVDGQAHLLYRRVQRRLGMSPMRIVWLIRTILANELIKLSPDWSLTDVAFSCGFTSSAHFSRLFKQTFGTTPSRVRRAAMLDEARARIGETSSMMGLGGSMDEIFASGTLGLARRLGV